MDNQTVRCKFRCTEIVKSLANPYENKDKARMLYTAKFNAVYRDNPENSRFFEATPSGHLEIGTFNQDLFEPGKEYYLDIVLAA